MRFGNHAYIRCAAAVEVWRYTSATSSQQQALVPVNRKPGKSLRSSKLMRSVRALFAWGSQSFIEKRELAATMLISRVQAWLGLNEGFTFSRSRVSAAAHGDQKTAGWSTGITISVRLAKHSGKRYNGFLDRFLVECAKSQKKTFVVFSL